MKHRISSIVLSCLLLGAVPVWGQTQIVTRQSSQQSAKPKPAPKKAVSRWQYQGDFREGLSLVKDANGKWGFIDTTGKLVIPCQWKFAQNFHNGLAEVDDVNGKRHKINKKGEIVK